MAGGIWFVLARRRRGPKALQRAHDSVAALRDRLALVVSGTPRTPGDLERLVGDAETALRDVPVGGLNTASVLAVEQALRAVEQVRHEIGQTGVPTAGEALTEEGSTWLTSLTSLDAALAQLREASTAGASTSPPSGGSTGGFSG